MVIWSRAQVLRADIDENDKVISDLRGVEAKLRKAFQAIDSFEPQTGTNVLATGLGNCVDSTAKALDLSTRLRAKRDRLLNLIQRPGTETDVETLEQTIQGDSGSLVSKVSNLKTSLQSLVTLAKMLSKDATPSNPIHRYSVEISAAIMVVATVAGTLALLAGQPTLSNYAFSFAGLGLLSSGVSYWLRPKWDTAVARGTDEAKKILAELPLPMVQL
ncbi:hypothetical protein FRC12_001376 [Ceratobasidium sp. 428]|nr:hypothetical protein FRC12_001376 [Ceratobasidium sp. 428]